MAAVAPPAPSAVKTIIKAKMGEDGAPAPLGERKCEDDSGPFTLAEDIEFALTLHLCGKKDHFNGSDNLAQKWQDVAATVATRNAGFPYRPGKEFKARKIYFNKVVKVHAV